MKRKPKVHEIMARALTDPQPKFVSLVKGGANQRPFRAVKMDAATAAASEQTRKESEMTQKDMAPEGHDIAALKFSSDVFKSEADVKTWLEQGGYEGYEIETTKSGFEVNTKDIEFEEGSIQKVEGAVKGLTVYVGKLAAGEASEKSDDEKLAEQAETNPSAVQPVATKSEASDGAAPKDAAKAEPAADAGAKTDATEPSEVARQIDEVHTTIKGMYEVSVLSQVLYSLKYLVDDADYTGMEDVDVEAVKEAAKTLIGVLASGMSDTVASLEEAFREIATKAGVSGWEVPADSTDAAYATKQEASSDEPSTKTEGSADNADTKVEADTQKSEDAAEGTSGEPVAATANDALAAAIKGLTDVVSTMQEGLAKIDAKVDATKEEITKRVDAVEQTSQSRKGADVTQEQIEALDAKKNDDGTRVTARRRLASALGHPDPSRA